MLNSLRSFLSATLRATSSEAAQQDSPDMTPSPLPTAPQRPAKPPQPQPPAPNPPPPSSAPPETATGVQRPEGGKPRRQPPPAAPAVAARSAVPTMPSVPARTQTHTDASRSAAATENDAVNKRARASGAAPIVKQPSAPLPIPRTTKPQPVVNTSGKLAALPVTPASAIRPASVDRAPLTKSAREKPPSATNATPVRDGVLATGVRNAPPPAAKPDAMHLASHVRRPSHSPQKRPRHVHPVPRPPQPSPHHQKRLDSVSREVFLLTGGVTPAPLAPVLPLPVKSKPTRRHHWRHVPFSNSARKDALQLRHWTKAGSADTDYTFARFNKPIRMVTYTDAEYAAAVANLLPLADPPSEKPKENNLSAARSGSLKHGIHRVPPQAPWTKKETDMLFDLCGQFDLRFAVVHDRWPDGVPQRSIDELKDRYYSVSKRLVEWRTQQGVTKSLPLALHKHCQAITMNPFDYEYECVRKNQLEWHYARSKAELREEEETVREARRIEANRRRLQKERQRLAKLLTPARELGPTASGDALPSSGVSQKTFPHRKAITGAYARSTMIYAAVSQSARISKRVDAALVELGVGLRPTPTAIVVDSFDLLRMEILSYIELQRTVFRKEEDTHLLRVKLAKLKGEPAPPPPPGITLSHKKRRADDVEIGSLFGPALKQQKT